MKEIKFTAKQARELQLEGNVNKRNEIIEKFRYEVWDNKEADGDLVNMQYDILLVAQTAYTRTIRFPAIKDEEEYNQIRKLFIDAGYGFCHDDETGGFFIIF